MTTNIRREIIYDEHANDEQTNNEETNNSVAMDATIPILAFIDSYTNLEMRFFQMMMNNECATNYSPLYDKEDVNVELVKINLDVFII